MKRTAVLLFVLTALFVGVAVSPAVAQPRCQPFSALMQAKVIPPPFADGIVPPQVIEADFAWGGVVFGMFGEEKAYLGGWFYGKDDKSGESTYGRANGRGKNGIYKFAFGTLVNGEFAVTDSFDLQLEQAVWTVDPDAIAYAGNYKASGRLANGKGLFEGASGQFTLHGDFAYWDTADGPLSAWNPVLDGSICR